MLDIFRQFHSYGTTVIVATHNRELVERHPGARVLRLDEGKITYANWTGAEIFEGSEAEDAW
jgi:cell division transport system ATP-binding protein